MLGFRSWGGGDASGSEIKREATESSAHVSSRFHNAKRIKTECDSVKTGGGSDSEPVASDIEAGSQIDDDISHVASCSDVITCPRCFYLRKKEVLESQCTVTHFPGFSWLAARVSRKTGWGLGCLVCEAAKQSSSFASFEVRTTLLGNLKKHGDTDQHREALKILGLVHNEKVRRAEAPSPEEFELVLQHRRGCTSLSLPLHAVGRRFKIEKMQWCLAEAGREMTREYLRQVASLAIAQDARKNKLLVRFSACSEKLRHCKGVLGHEYVKDGHFAQNINSTLDAILHRFCTVGAGGPGPTSLDTDLLARLHDRIEIYCADAASNEFCAGRLARNDTLPNLLTVLKDKSHASVRVLKRPWAADAEMTLVMDTVILHHNSITQRIDHSDTFSDVFARFCAKSSDVPVDGARIHNMRGQKNRFASYSKPLGRACIFLDALISTACWICVQRRGEEQGRDAGDFLAFLNEENEILMAMMSDAASACVGLTRSLDTEDYDAATLNWEITSLVQTLHFLFIEGSVVEHGYTKQMLLYLRRQRAYMDGQDRPRCLGGPGTVSADMLQRCIDRLQMFVNLACETLRAEFPDYDLLSSFAIFDLDTKTMKSSEAFADRTQSMARLAQILKALPQHLVDEDSLRAEFVDVRPMAMYEHRKGCSNVDAWVQTILRLERKQASVRRNHPTAVLRQVVQRYAAFSGLTTSGVEQGFSQIQRHCTPERNHMLLDTELDETVLQLPQTVFSDHEITRRAVDVWLKYFNPPRARPTTTQRIDAGVPKMKGVKVGAETAWKAAESKSLSESVQQRPEVSIDEVQSLARSMTSHLMCDKVLAEEAFQKTKQYKNKLVAYLDNALLHASEVDEDCVQVAEAFKDAQQKEDAKNGRLRKRRADLLNPVRVPNPRTKHVYYAPGVVPPNLDCLVGDPEHADFIVEKDPSNPHDECYWCAFLLGTCICNDEFIRRHGQQGVCFNFQPAIHSKRQLFVSASFGREHPRLAEVLRFACSHHGSKWRELASLEAFAEASTKVASKSPLSVLGLFSQTECAALQEKNILDGDGFAKLLAKQDACSMSVDGGQTAAAAAAAAALDPVAEMADNVNDDYTQAMHHFITTIMGHHIFDDILTADPIGIHSGGNGNAATTGSKACYDAADFDRAMKACGTYQGAGNLFWINFKWRPCSHVFTNMKAVEEVCKFNFSKGPAPFPWRIVVALPSSKLTAATLQKQFGALKRVSPEEQEAALLMAITRRIEAGATDEELKQWRKTLLTVDMEFIPLPTEDDQYFKSVNLRRAVIVDNEAVVRSCIQSIQEIMEFKLRKEKGMGHSMTAEELCTTWNAHAIEISSKYTEEISPTWIQNAVKIQNNILSDKDLRNVVMWMEGEYGKKNPLNSINALDAVVSCTKTREDILWVLDMMTHCLKFLGMTAADFSSRNLGNKKGKGIVHLFLFKRMLLEYLNTWLVSRGFGEEQRAMLSQLLTPESYRKCCGAAGMKVDTQWMGLKAGSTRLLIQFVKNAIYSQGMDQCLKQAIKNTMDPKDVIQAVQTLKDALDELEACFQKECGPQAPSKKIEDAEPETMDKSFTVPLGELVTPEQQKLDVEGELSQWQEYLEEIFSQWVSFILNDSSSTTLAENMKEMTIVQATIEKSSGNKLLVYDCKTAGEASSHPNTRQPPFKPKDLTKWVHAVIRSFDDDGKTHGGTLPPQHLVCVMDGGKFGNEGQIQSAFLDLDGKLFPKESQKFVILTTQKSLGDRKERVKGFINQSENLHVMCTGGPLEIENKARLYLPDATTHGTLLGYFKAPSFLDSECWRVDPALKRKMLGTNGKILTGGAAADPLPKPKFEDGLEPMAWHFTGKQVWEELLHAMDAQVVIAATCLDHLLPCVCLERRVPIVVACWTEEHRQALKTKIMKCLWAMFLDETSPHHQPALCKLLNLKNTKRKPPPAAAAKSGKKPRGSKTAKNGADDDDAMGEPEETESVEKALPDPKDAKAKAAAPKQAGRKAGNASQGSDAKAKLLEKLMAASGFTVTDLLDADDEQDRIVWPRQKGARHQLKAAIENIVMEHGDDPLQSHYFIDVSCAMSRKPKVCKDLCPTLTRARAGLGGFWLSWKNRMMNTNEITRFMGVLPEEIPMNVVSERHLRLLAGNAIPVPMLGRILRAMLRATGRN
ncbi:unnamed protein product [Symbiodinium sp. CCMP2592]|nr:unnamed protein product [Symbiodinium sp. CCMP2592]